MTASGRAPPPPPPPPVVFDRSLVAAQVRDFVAAYVDTHPSSRLSRVRYLSFEALSFDGERPRRPAARAQEAGGDEEEAGQARVDDAGARREEGARADEGRGGGKV